MSVEETEDYVYEEYKDGMRICHLNFTRPKSPPEPLTDSQIRDILATMMDRLAILEKKVLV